MPPPKPLRGFSFFGRGGDSANSRGGSKAVPPPSLNLQTDRDVYKPGDPVVVTIEIRNNSPSSGLGMNNGATTSSSSSGNSDAAESSLLIERLAFEIKGIEKLDTQWFTTQKSSPDLKQRRGRIFAFKSSVALRFDSNSIRHLIGLVSFVSNSIRHLIGLVSFAWSADTSCEYVFMDCSATSLVSNQIINCGATKTYLPGFELRVKPLKHEEDKVAKGGERFGFAFRGFKLMDSKSLVPFGWVQILCELFYQALYHHLTGVLQFDICIILDACYPANLWYWRMDTLMKNRVLILPSWKLEFHCKSGSLKQPMAYQLKKAGVMSFLPLFLGIVPASTVVLDIYWKEMDGDSDWATPNETYDGVEEGYESSRDEISSVSSYNPTKENLHTAFGSSLSLQSSVGRFSNPDASYLKERTSIHSYMPLPQLSVAEVLYDSGGDILTPRKSSATGSPSQQLKHSKSLPTDDDLRVASVPGAVEPLACNSFPAAENFIRGRSYNIRLDDQVLLRFSPKSSDSSYYFSDMIGGTLTFFNEEGSRRCLELSITLELSETINRRFVHPSRRHSPTITKVSGGTPEDGSCFIEYARRLALNSLGLRTRHRVQSDHHEVVADLLQTSFLFSIPMDGPMSFSTPRISVQWALRFEFFTTPKNVDWTRFEHPLLIEGRDKCEWVLPITVHAPPVGTPGIHTRSEKPVTLEPLWLRT
ncbi:hypothetical protein RHSIM_Rhsim06G0125800 [Rhododendron simsii]|uniref:Reduced growth phenotype protein 1 n=1 Tax=Rhododendron simsii TaxID=118357 RepID=A0A834H254_RHOSS|nr:hypothetical protein RHSIM_Rhsim06G0125800 [Rhododendron simsii]